MISSGDRGLGANPTPAASAAMAINARYVVFTFCIKGIKKDKNRRALAQPWPEGIISTADADLLREWGIDFQWKEKGLR